MIYTKYITKKRMRLNAICGAVNLPWGTILPVVDGFIVRGSDRICAAKSQNAKDFFWGYADDNPEEEIERQMLAAELLKLAPQEDKQALFESNNPWRKYGRLEQIPAGFEWVWNIEFVEGLPMAELEGLIAKIGSKRHG